jgi:hypothetical protein
MVGNIWKYFEGESYKLTVIWGYQWDLCVAIYIHVSEIHTQGNNLNI